MPKKRETENSSNTETTHNVRLYADETARLEWATKQTGTRSLAAFMRQAALERELELRALIQSGT